jgi:hypothetical protein
MRTVNLPETKVTHAELALTIPEVEALLVLYQELPDEMNERLFSPPDEGGDLNAAGSVLHGMYHWNREYFS